jgi:hypothetical protein
VDGNQNVHIRLKGKTYLATHLNYQARGIRCLINETVGRIV